MTMQDYLAFFKKWLDYQFSHDDQEPHKALIFSVVTKEFVTDEEEASYWSNRDCWSMYDLANKVLQKQFKYNA
jgi:hypothetical protein